ncbi:prealbumin-like fold domain-containing protein [Lactobacillus sp. CC-MHH1034]|uniref:SpaA isopeptide-forming pilin-related protein n=1 Tax=Agrilactobacillus fermenti TaxID=2586909 RepID=UPI001E43C4B5|nr:SpaA isopeptide-forming pilin-related protein [Agrilactobacillus fermenti]MCD2256504.1 prealbumin-like fold domain-containing protein [Agrilactobacillus fermenti]
MIARKQFTSRYVIRLLVVCLALLTGFLIREGTNHIRAETSASPEKELVIHDFGLNHENKRVTNDGTEKTTTLTDPVFDSRFVVYDVTDVYRSLVYQGLDLTKINEQLLNLEDAALLNKLHYELPKTNAAGLTQIMLPERSVGHYQDQTKAVYLVKAPGTDKKALLNHNLSQKKAKIHLYFANYFAMQKVQFNSVYFDYEQGKLVPAANEYILGRSTAGDKWYQGVDSENRPLYTKNKAEAYKFIPDAHGYASAEIPWAAMGPTMHYFQMYQLQEGLHEAANRTSIQIHSNDIDGFEYRAMDELGHVVRTPASEVPNMVSYMIPTPKLVSNVEDAGDEKHYTFKVQMPLPFDISSYQTNQWAIKIGSDMPLMTDPKVLRAVAKDADGQTKYTIGGQPQPYGDGQNGFKIDFTTMSTFQDLTDGDYMEVEYQAKTAADVPETANVSTEVTYNNNHENKISTYTFKPGYNFKKINQSQQPLQGAVFVIYRLSGATKQYYMSGGSWSSSVNPEQAKRYTSNSAGIISFLGEPNMPTGTYYLKEIQPPPGYKPRDDMTFTITLLSYDQTMFNPQTVVNIKEEQPPAFVVPVTGGNGIIWLVGASILVILGTIVYFKKKQHV